MFSSLASFFFGSNTTATTNSDTNQNPTRQEDQLIPQEQAGNIERIDVANTIQVTSSTPSVTGSSNNNIGRNQHLKRGAKNKRNNKNNKKRHESQPEEQGRQQISIPSLTNLLTATDCFEEDFDEDDWCIVEREDEDISLPRTDSEEELSVAEVKQKQEIPSYSNGQNSTRNSNNTAPQQTRRRQQNASHSLYSGPRPQQQRNYLQRARNSGARGVAGINVSALSPPRNIADDGVGSLADVGLTQSLYVASPNQYERHSDSGSENNFGANVSMEESWFITPPPCFTSIGPIHMETSPFENLLIEHPSMSVYHSIRSAQEATDSFVNLDLGVNESQTLCDNNSTEEADKAATANTVARPQVVTNTTSVQQPRSTGARIDSYTAAQLKQELLVRNSQKCMEKKERQNLSRSAINRANKARQFQSNGRRQRRADMQHCKIISGANNNRKCCF